MKLSILRRIMEIEEGVIRQGINLQERCIFDVTSSLNTKFFQIWSSVTGYGELCGCF